MDDQQYVFATVGVILLYFLVSIMSRRFDPFAPVWLFLVGYVQVYIIQAISYREWALDIRGKDLVTAANFRAFWALLWFLAVYHLGMGRLIAPRMPRPPRGWSPMLVGVLSPPVDRLGPVLLGIPGRRGTAIRGYGLGRGGTVSLVSIRDDGGGDHDDRDRS